MVCKCIDTGSLTEGCLGGQPTPVTDICPPSQAGFDKQKGLEAGSPSLGMGTGLPPLLASGF